MIKRGRRRPPLYFYGGIYMAREYTRDASEYGQQLIADAIRTVGLSTQVDTTLEVEGMAADAKATGDAIALKADAEDVTALNALISDDGTTMMLFGKVVTIDSETGVVSLSDPEEDNTEEVSGT